MTFSSTNRCATWAAARFGAAMEALVRSIDFHPDGDRLRGIGVLLYMLGLSYRAIEQFLPVLDPPQAPAAFARRMLGAGAPVWVAHPSAEATAAGKAL